MRPLLRLLQSGATRLGAVPKLDRRRIEATVQTTAICLLALMAVGCKKPIPKRAPETVPEVRVEPAPKLKTFSWTPRLVEGGRCEDEIARVIASPKAPGTPKLDAERVQILMKAKAEP